MDETGFVGRVCRGFRTTCPYVKVRVTQKCGRARDDGDERLARALERVYHESRSLTGEENTKHGGLAAKGEQRHAIELKVKRVVSEKPYVAQCRA